MGCPDGKCSLGLPSESSTSGRGKWLASFITEERARELDKQGDGGPKERDMKRDDVQWVFWGFVYQLLKLTALLLAFLIMYSLVAG